MQINYMWNFKPNEIKDIYEFLSLNMNKNFITDYNIIYPKEIDQLLINNKHDISTNFKDLINLLDIIPKWIIKTDIYRILYIYYNGGIYSDVDCYIQKKLDIEKDEYLYLYTEKICKNIKMLGKRETKNKENLHRISNYFFGTDYKQHPFLKLVINECINRLNQLLLIEKKNEKNINHGDILWVCGPDVITSMYHIHKNNYKIKLFDDTYIKHTCLSSWR